MLVDKPSWVHHDSGPIFSIDIHPDGTRFCTAGGDSKIRIWNMEPVVDEAKGKDDKCPKRLCELANHCSSVNCVRWSPNGRYLASGADDQLVLVFERMQLPAGFSSGFGGKTANTEHWSCTHNLRGHVGDVCDLAWSADNTKLASCSLDNQVIIWDTVSFTKLATLQGHSGWVKGVCWDPVGKYLASQSEDRSVIIWRVADWGQEKVITQPFLKASGSTFFRRLSWSPDGQYVTTTNAYKKPSHIACILSRNKNWEVSYDFVGHNAPVVVVRYNAALFAPQTNDNEVSTHYTCCAVGSQDSSLSIWVTHKSLPIVIATDMFEQSVVDISWGRDGYTLLCCSMDGSVGYFHFDEAELGKKLPDSEQERIFRQAYGIVPGQEPVPLSIAESPDVLAIEQAHKLQVNDAKQDAATNGHTTPAVAGPLPTNAQIETTRPDGRRRIIPQVISCAAAAFSSTPAPPGPPPPPAPKDVPTFSDKDATTSPSQAPSSTPKLPAASKPPTSSSPTPGSSPNLDQSTSNKRKSSSSAPSSSPAATPSGSVPSSAPAPAASAAVAAAPSLQPSSKKPKTTGQGASAVPVSAAKQAPAPSAVANTAAASSSAAAVGQAPRGPMLPVSVPASTLSRQLRPGTGRPPSEALTLLESTSGESSGKFYSMVKCSCQGKIIWADRLLGRASLLTGNVANFSATACFDGSLYVHSPAGRRLLPPIILGSPVVYLESNDLFCLLAITADCQLYSWDVRLLKCTAKCSVASLVADSAFFIERVQVSETGAAIVTLTNGHSFVYHTGLEAWLRLADDSFLPSLFNSTLTSRVDGANSGPLAALKSRASLPQSVHPLQLLSTDRASQTSITTAHLETLVAGAQALGSGTEYTSWLRTYVSTLAEVGNTAKIKEVCDALLGPPFRPDSSTSEAASKTSFWEPTVGGVSKRKLLQELILPQISSNRQLQRLVTEYTDALNEIKKAKAAQLS